MEHKKIAIIGTVGVPGGYGGFETLADNLVKSHYEKGLGSQVTVYCSSKDSQRNDSHYLDAQLRYIPLSANGIQSVLYDICSVVKAIKNGDNVLLLLGVSGAVFIPLVKRIFKKRIVINVDGIEWQRPKWGWFASKFLKLSERIAVMYSDVVISDNEEITRYLESDYGVSAETIEYGGDHGLGVNSIANKSDYLPDSYALCICRIEPENNITMILSAWENIDFPLVFVGNWSRSEYGTRLKEKYRNKKNYYLLEPIYEKNELHSIRRFASFYVHGHSAGGTNPSLVEIMHYEMPIFAFDCCFNRSTTENFANYFSGIDELCKKVRYHIVSGSDDSKFKMKEIATRRYTWDSIASRYYDILHAK